MFVRHSHVSSGSTSYRSFRHTLRGPGHWIGVVLFGLSPFLALSCAASRPDHATSVKGGSSAPSPSSSHAPAPSAVLVPLPPSAAEVAEAEQRVRTHATDPTARIALATLYRRSGKIPEAARQLQTAVRIAPKSAEAYRQLADIYRDARYLDRETEALTAAVRLEPGDWQSALRLAYIYLDLGWYDHAQQALAQASRAAPQEPRVLVRQAAYASVRQQYPAMEKAAQEGARIAPNDATFYVILSEANRLQGNYPAAERFLRQALKQTTDPVEQAQHYSRLAFLLLDTSWHPSRVAEAEQAARTAVEKNPQSLEAHYWLGRALEMQHKTAEAQAQYEIAARQDIQFESVAFQLGRLYLRSPDPAQRAQGQKLMTLYQTAEQNARAYERARTALSADLGNADLHRKMAVWYLKTNRNPEAILELRRTLELRPSDREARRLLVQTLRSVGRITEANAYAH